MKPDLVLANKEVNRKFDVERLRAAGIAVRATDIQTLDGAVTSLRTMFTAGLGWPAPDWLELIEQTWRQPPPAPPVRAAIPIWRDPWMVVGSRTFTGGIAARLGLEDVRAAAHAMRICKLNLIVCIHDCGDCHASSAELR